jgi:GMP synthase (glutamine-hydrolysing)
MAFAQRLQIDIEDVQQFDILADELDPAILQDVDALLVGGAGEFSVVDPVEPVQRFISFLSRVAEDGPPLFASCFGFQALVVGLGGEVIPDEPNAEVGTYRLKRTQRGAADPLFSSLPDSFLAQLGHKDRAAALPTGLDCLAESQLAPFQALRVQGRPVYATQFHPELTYLDNRLRFERYMDEYGRLFGKEEAQRKLDAHEPSPEANELLSMFAKRFVFGVDG